MSVLQGGTGGLPSGAGAVAAAGDKLMGDEDSAPRQRLSPRQHVLDKKWSFYKAKQYDGRKVAWDGSTHVGQFERDTVARAGYVPSGFYIANSETLPNMFRRPTTPYHVCRVIVDRFTGLLFGERNPQIVAKGDDDTTAFLKAVADEGRLMAQFLMARTFGGATGDAVVGFKLLEGRPYFEAFDPRWCTPRFVDRANLVLGELEYMYTFPQDVRVEGEWHTVDFWYRRVITATTDTIFVPELVRESSGKVIEPQWRVAEQVDHGLGFCPVTWIQNMPVATEIDGDSDCEGVFEMAEAIDRLNAGSERAISANLDPTLHLGTDRDVGSVQKGSDNALVTEKGGTAQYVEITGGGITAADAKTNDYREKALEVAQCVLDQPDGNMTATQARQAYAPMLAKATVLKQQYGDFGIKRLMNMVITAAARLTTARVEGDAIVRRAFALPKRVLPDGSLADYKLGPGPYYIELTWPPTTEPSPEDAQKATTAVIAAWTAGLIDRRSAAVYLAPYYGVQDVDAMLAIAAEELGTQQKLLEERAVKGPL